MQTAKRLGLKEQIELVISRTIKDFGHSDSIVGIDGIILQVEEILEHEHLTPSAKYQAAAEKIDSSILNNQKRDENERHSEGALKQLIELRDLFNRSHSEAFDREVYTDKERLIFLLKQVEEERAIYHSFGENWSRAVLLNFAGDENSPVSSINDQRDFYLKRISKMEREIVKIFKAYPQEVQEKFAQEVLDMQRQEKLDVN